MRRTLIATGTCAAIATLAALPTIINADSDARERPASHRLAAAHVPLHRAAATTPPQHTPAGHIPTGHIPANAVPITIGATPFGRTVKPGFVGLSIEYTALTRFAGANPQAVNPVLVRLIRNLAPNAQPNLRLGGDTTDWTWWRVAGMPRPRGIRYTLTRRWLGVLKALTTATDARLILGINLEANSSLLAQSEAKAFTNTLPASQIAALEIGNEPELYGGFGWYSLHHRPVFVRPRSYDLRSYTTEFASTGAILPHVALAGPASGGINTAPQIPGFVARARHLSTVTIHRYPLARCYLPANSRLSPTIEHLLATTSSIGLAGTVAPYAAAAHAHNLQLRVDELNSVSCGGKRGVSDTFASALWAIDTLYAMVQAGADGVNVHTFPHAVYKPFATSHSGGRWHATVEPLYYGLLMFTRGAPAGARLLPVTIGAPAGTRLLAITHGPIARATTANLRTWATKAPDGRTRVTLINENRTHATTVVVAANVPADATATAQTLKAPGLRARQGVTLAGQSFGHTTTTGELNGAEHTKTIDPVTGRYVLRLPPASATLLTLP